MAYLDTSEYEQYGLSEKTPEALVAAASELIDAHCRRTTLAVAQYTERFRLGKANAVRLSYLPLVVTDGANSAIVQMRTRCGTASRDWFDMEPLQRELQAFATPGIWQAQDVSNLDVNATTGEVLFGSPVLGFPASEVELTYTAGYAITPEQVKQACAMVVRNALATPALNVRASNVDRLHMQYFSDSLLDANVKEMLTQYVAQKVG